MNLLPTWPIAAGALVIGLCGGAYVDHSIMESRINKMTAAHAEELRVREVQRAKDEAAARSTEQALATKIATIEQARVNENTTSSTVADALRERLRNQAASKPANPSRVSQAASSCETTTGREFSVSTGENLVQLAQRADELRSALSACYQAYDSVAK